MTKLVLIRHGESNATVERRIGGPLTCTGLSPLGRSQALALGERLARTGELTPDVLVSSAYPRARETADLIAPSVGDLPVAVEPDLGEHDPGPECDGLTFEAFVTRYGTPDWETNPYATTFPGGETIAEFQHRVGAALHRVATEHDGRTVMIVCHGGVIDRALRLLLRTAPTGQFQIHTVNTGLTEFVRVRPDLWRMYRYNDAAHLAGLPAETPRD